VSSMFLSFAEVVRVSVDGEYVGFIEIRSTDTLCDARLAIASQLGGSGQVQATWQFPTCFTCCFQWYPPAKPQVPQEFEFVLNDGVPVSRRQESLLSVKSLKPSVHIRSCAVPSTSRQGSGTLALP
jgi:hypothetical protein